LSRTLSLGPPFPLSVVSGLADPFRHTLLPVDARSVRNLAERLNRLDDYGGGGVLERLDDTVDCLKQVEWNALGHFGIRYLLNYHLGNRLRLVELLKRRPDIDEVPIERPLIITGLFRTGTTFLHNVLATDPANRVGRTWELAHPVGRRRDLLRDDEWRRWRGSHEVAMNHMMIPEQSEVHHVETDSYEEDFFLLENDMAVMELALGLGDHGYAMRMLDWDMLEPYQWHKRQLQLLWMQRSATRWLLKCPWHLWHLDAVLRVYPDALIVQTHRSLPSTIGSQCSLSARMASKFQRTLDLAELGRFWVEYSQIGVERGLAAREAFPGARMHDVRLSDLEARPLETVREIYDVFGMPWNDALEAAFGKRIAEAPTAQLGEHEYDIADYGLTEQGIEDAFADYRKRFGV